MKASRYILLRASVVLFACVAFGVPAAGAQANGLRNGGFEEGDSAGVPVGWTAAGQGYRFRIVAETGVAGAHAVEISRPAAAAGGVGWLAQSVDAAPFRGRRVRLRGYVSANAGRGGSARLSVNVKRPAGQGAGFYDGMEDRPVRDSAWRRYEVVGDVAPDAEKISVTVQLIGGASAAFDGLSLEAVGPAAPVRTDVARPLAARGLENETAFARLLGYVRWFHPSDEAAGASWNAFAVRGARAVEDARTPAELAARLRALVGPLAPTVRIGTRPFAPGEREAAPAGATRSVAWRHTGVATGASPEIYHEERVSAPLPDASVADSMPSPGRPLLASLGGGVYASIPLAVYADSAGTLPRSGAPLPPEPTGTAAFSGDDRATRLADVAIAWNVYQHFYPYFGVVTDWPSVLRSSLRSAATDADAGAFTGTLRRMVAAARDGHGLAVLVSDSAVYSPQVLLGYVQGRVVVLAAAPEAGLPLRRGDVVETVDGVPAAALMRRTEATVSGATPQFRHVRALQEMLKGPHGSVSVLAVRRGSAATAVVRAVRTTRNPQVKEQRPEKVAEVAPGIVYVDLDRVNNDDLLAALPRLAAARGVVVDMRGYPRNVGTPRLLQRLTRRTIYSSHFNVPVVTRPDREGVRWDDDGRWKLEPDTPYISAPTAFVIDGRAISYAESTAGVVENNHLAALVGEPTAGSNGNVNSVRLPGGYSVSWTGMRVLKDDGSPHHGVGILPTVPVSPTLAGLAAGRDELLEAAITLVTRAAAK
jgi:C-terminal processing protease CtpA/Prc